MFKSRRIDGTSARIQAIEFGVEPFTSVLEYFFFDTHNYTSLPTQPPERAPRTNWRFRPIMSTPSIQLAFQGGGAKLAAMLPIAHAFRDAEIDEYVAIHRTSGTSAGSICAALVATQADFGAVRRYLIDKGPGHLAALVPPRLKPLIARSKDGLKFGLWHFVRERQMLLDVAVHGEPLLASIELSRSYAPRGV